MKDLKELTKLNKDQAMALHKEMWNLLYKRVVENDAFPNKAGAIEVMGYQPYSIVNQCFCCHYASLRLQSLVKKGIFDKADTIKTEYMCSQCPFKMSHLAQGPVFTAPCMRADASYYQIVTRKNGSNYDIPVHSYEFIKYHTKAMAKLPERTLTPLSVVATWKK